MAEWVDKLESKRAQLVKRGSRLGSRRAAEVLTRMRAGTLDWRATLDARQAHELGQRGAAFQLGGWQRRVVTQLDEMLLRAGDALHGGTRAPSLPGTHRAEPTTEVEVEHGQAHPPAVVALPIEGYDTLTAKQVLIEIRTLDDAARARIADHERAHKARKTVLRALP